jgi:DNA-binding NarL/FixJ family response regulator
MRNDLAPLIEREHIGALERAHFPAPSITLLRRAFDLTPSEASVAQGFARGWSPAEIATLRRSQCSSIKTHLAHIFSKTKTMKQPHLCVLLCNLAYLEHFANVAHEPAVLCDMLDEMCEPRTIRRALTAAYLL